MKSSQKSKNAGQDKASINLPSQKVWKQLEEYGVESYLKKEDSAMNCKKVKKIGRLLDKAFELLLEKLIRQN